MTRIQEIYKPPEPVVRDREILENVCKGEFEQLAKDLEAANIPQQEFIEGVIEGLNSKLQRVLQGSHGLMETFERLENSDAALYVLEECYRKQPLLRQCAELIEAGIKWGDIALFIIKRSKNNHEQIRNLKKEVHSSRDFIKFLARQTPIVTAHIQQLLEEFIAIEKQKCIAAIRASVITPYGFLSNFQEELKVLGINNVSTLDELFSALERKNLSTYGKIQLAAWGAYNSLVS